MNMNTSEYFPGYNEMYKGRIDNSTLLKAKKVSFEMKCCNIINLYCFYNIND